MNRTLISGFITKKDGVKHEKRRRRSQGHVDLGAPEVARQDCRRKEKRTERWKATQKQSKGASKMALNYIEELKKLYYMTLEFAKLAGSPEAQELAEKISKELEEATKGASNNEGKRA